MQGIKSNKANVDILHCTARGDSENVKYSGMRFQELRLIITVLSVGAVHDGKYVKPNHLLILSTIYGRF